MFSILSCRAQFCLNWIEMDKPQIGHSTKNSFFFPRLLIRPLFSVTPEADYTEGTHTLTPEPPALPHRRPLPIYSCFLSNARYFTPDISKARVYLSSRWSLPITVCQAGNLRNDEAGLGSESWPRH